MKKKTKGISIHHIYAEVTRKRYLGISFPLNGGGRRFQTFDPELAESPAKLRRALVKAGAKLIGTKDGQEKKLAKLLVDIPDKLKILVDKPGFRTTKAGLGYVCGPFMLGAAKGRYRWQPTDANRGVGTRQGSLEGWREKVAPMAGKSTYAMFAVFAALASPLNNYVRMSMGKGPEGPPLMTEGPVFNFWGESSTGKSSLSQITVGVWGNPRFIMDWDFTRCSLEEICAAHNDGPMVIDDTDKSTEADMSKKVALKLVNQTLPKGQSKSISGKARNDYPQLYWSTFGFSSSQKPFDEEAQAVGFTRSVGEKCRLFDIPVPPISAGGIFDRVEGSDEHRKNEAVALIQKLEAGLAAHYGVLMPAWIQFLLAKDRAARIRGLVGSFVAQVAPNADGQEGRVAKKFGVVYAAGVLAIEAGLLPWSPDEPMRVVRKLYRPARQALVSDADLARARLKTLADVVSNTDKFPKHTGGTVNYSPATIGVRARYNGQNVGCIRDQEFGKLVGTAAVKKAILKRLSEAGALVAGQGHAGTVQHRLPIRVDDQVLTRPRFWLIKLDKLAAAAGTTQ